MFVQIMPKGPKMAPPQGHMFFIGLYIGRNMDETTRPRALIFGMQHNLL